MFYANENKQSHNDFHKTVLFYVSSNIPFCGHSEDKENFIKLLHFCIDVSSEDLKKDFARTAESAKYTSSLIQNEIEV